MKMSGVDEILSYKKNPNEDFYALLNCDEHSSVSAARQFANSKNFSRANRWDFHYQPSI